MSQFSNPPHSPNLKTNVQDQMFCTLFKTKYGGFTLYVLYLNFLKKKKKKLVLITEK